MSDLYEDDILLWSEHQAEALRRRAANEIDWENVAEEIEAVGRSQRTRWNRTSCRPCCMTSRLRGGRGHAMCRTGARRPAVIGTMHAGISRRRWRSGSM